jgi:hypothetical protein
MAENYDDNSTLEEIRDSLEAIHSTLKERSFGNEFGGIVVAIFFFFFLSDWSGSKLDRWTDRLWYSGRYGSNWENTIIERRPVDCDWGHAPLGSKGCHYVKSVNGFGPHERQRLIDQATTAEQREEFQKLPYNATVSWEKKFD